MLPALYSDINENLVNSMVALITYKQFGDKMFENPDDFNHRFSYIESGYANLDYFNEANSSDSSLLVFSNIPTSDCSSYEEYGYKELNTPECPISRYLTEDESSKHKNTLSDVEKKIFYVYVNEEKKSVVLSCTRTININDLLRFFSATPRIWHWIYDAKNLSEDEINLFKEMSKKHKANGWFEPLINKLYPYGAEETILNARLRKYSLSGLTKQIEDLEYDIRSLDSSIARHMDDLSAALTKKENKMEILTGLRNIPADGDDSVLTFFKNQKDIRIIDIRVHRNPEIRCAVKTLLEYYDKDRYEKIFNNPSSFVNQYPYKDIVDVMHALFQYEKGKLVVQSEFILVGLSSINYYKAYELDGIDYNDCMPTPHLGFHRCLGSNEQAIMTYLREGQWDFAIYQTIAATKNLNFSDSTVVTSLMNHLNRNRTIPYIVADNGEKMCVNEFITYINEKKKVENE